MSNTIIRRLTESNIDYEEAGRLLLASYKKELGDSFNYKVDFNKVKEVVLDNYSYGLFDNDKFVGILCGQINESFLGYESIYQVMLWYVADGYNVSGLYFFKYVERALKKVGVKKVVMSHAALEDNSRMQLLYNKLGYRPIEVQYIKEL